MTSAVEQQIGVSIKDLLEGLVDVSVLQSFEDVVVSGLASDSRKASKGGVFFAYQGTVTHGLLYAKDVVRKGVAVVIWDDECEGCEDIISEISTQVLCLHCENLKTKVGEIANRFYLSPSSELNVIGVTGTDGKTSVAHYIAQCLDSDAKRCGLMGTLGNGFIDDLRVTGLTTSDALNVHQSLAAMRDAGAEHVVMEVSSHGLDQERVGSVSFDVAVFSNLSQDHLDYHKTLDDYAAAKRKLFFRPGLKLAVINLDDPFGIELAEVCKQHLCVWGFSMQSDVSALEKYADFVVHVSVIEPIENGFHLTVKTPKGSASFDIGLLGMFNVSNVLAALTALLVSNIPFDDAIQKLSAIRPVVGRMDLVVVSEKPTVVVDFAHTPNALASVCSAAKEHFKGNLWCVFGCGGDRDKTKRPIMAAIAEKSADKVIVTSDNPRHEDPQAIIDDIAEGFKNKENVKFIVDRKEAIAYAISNAGKDDVVLLVGKGHELTQIVGDRYIEFDDRSVAKECLGVLG